MSLTEKTINGMKWIYLSAIVISVTQLIYTAFMARLLDPVAFGLVAMANVIIRFGNYFAKMGIGPALIQKNNLEIQDINTGYTLTIFISGIVFITVFLLSPFAGVIFKTQSVIPIIRVLSISLLLNGLSTFTTSLLRRKFSFKALSISEMSSFVISTIFIGLPLASLGFGVWSLVFSTIAQGLLLFAFSYFSLKARFHFNFAKASGKSLLSFGGKLSVINFLEYVNYSIDSLIIGNKLGAAQLGTYNRASLLINLPAQQLTNGLSKVIFPSLSETQDSQEKMQKAYYSMTYLYAWILFPIAFGISAVSKEIVPVILGPQWLDAIPILRIIALTVPFTLITSIQAIFFDSTARLKPRFVLITGRLMILLILFFFLGRENLLGFAYAVLITEILYFCTLEIVCVRFLKTNIISSIKAVLIPIGMSILIFAVLNYLSIYSYLNSLNSIILFFLEIVISGCIYLIVTFIMPPDSLRKQILNLARHFSGNKLVAFLTQKLQ